MCVSVFCWKEAVPAFDSVEFTHHVSPIESLVLRICKQRRATIEPFPGLHRVSQVSPWTGRAFKVLHALRHHALRLCLLTVRLSEEVPEFVHVNVDAGPKLTR